MIQPLLAVADLRAGHPFRGSIPEVPGGNGYALQMRDVSADGLIDWNGLTRTAVEGRREPDWLKPGDIVFVARGQRNLAVCLTEVPIQVVCSQYFFLLRLKSEHLLPEFLAWQINRGPCQLYLTKNAEGTDQLSIRRSVLENLPIVVPPIETQERVVALQRDAWVECRLLEQLIHNRERQLDALAFDLFSPEKNRR